MAVINSHILLLIVNLKLNPPKQKTQPKPIGMLHPDPFHMQGYIKTQNEGVEKDLPTKWRAKINKQIKNRNCNSHL